MVRIVDRYVFLEAAGLFALGFMGFLAFLIVNKLFLEVSQLLNPQVPASAVVSVILLEAPSFATWALPVAILFATLMSMGRLAKDNELTAMFTNGVSLYRLFLPFFVLSFLSCLLSYLSKELLVPRAATQQQALYDAFPAMISSSSLDSDPFISRLDNGEFVAASFFDKKQGRLNNVVYDDWGRKDGKRFMTAHVAISGKDGLTMGSDSRNPAVIFDDVDDQDGLYDRFITEPVTMVPLGTDIAKNYTAMKTPQELTQADLARQTRAKQALGKPVAADATAFHLRFSEPFASLAFALVAMPLALRAPRDERLLGLILSFILMMVYYLIWFVAKLMGANEILPPWIAAWLMNIVFAGIALMIFIYSRK